MQYEHYLNNTFLFWCIVTFIVTALIFSKIDINLGVIYGSLMCLFVLYFVAQNHKYNESAEDKIIKTKNSLIHPDFIEKENHKEISQYIFFIQDFYVLNPQAYEEFIDNINKFFQSLKLIEYDPNNAGTEYDLLNQYKRKAKNALHSIIYRMPNNIQYKKNSMLRWLNLMNCSTSIQSAPYTFRKKIFILMG